MVGTVGSGLTEGSAEGETAGVGSGSAEGCAEGLASGVGSGDKDVSGEGLGKGSFCSSPWFMLSISCAMASLLLTSTSTMLSRKRTQRHIPKGKKQSRYTMACATRVSRLAPMGVYTSEFANSTKHRRNSTRLPPAPDRLHFQFTSSMGLARRCKTANHANGIRMLKIVAAEKVMASALRSAMAPTCPTNFKSGSSNGMEVIRVLK